MLLDEAVYHSEHLRLGLRDEFALPEETAPACLMATLVSWLGWQVTDRSEHDIHA